MHDVLPRVGEELVHRQRGPIRGCVESTLLRDFVREVGWGFRPWPRIRQDSSLLLRRGVMNASADHAQLIIVCIPAIGFQFMILVFCAGERLCFFSN